MPIYPYRCDSCGHTQDFLQKLSEPRHTVCPTCSKETFNRTLTAAGFQLKGSGWYVTDFRDGGKKPETGDAAKAAPVVPAAGAVAADSGSSSGSGSNSPSATPAAAPAPAPTPAAPSSASNS
jgi:putative FmdB family regulatory protein